MGLLGKLTQEALDIAALPIDVAKDVVKLPYGVDDESAVAERLRGLKEKAGELYDSLDDSEKEI